ncbi:MAG: glycosyltransferase [Alphaproteobacteria bacterium]|nr:glycosyltransferase [Alphaproteobacteria bacterium]
MEPLLSIITVCKNEPFIADTCKSVVSQSCRDFEWLVIDGASTDGTLEKIRPYKDAIDVLVSEPDNGIYEAMNKGIRMARGRYLLFLNGGDCLYDKRTLAQVMPHLEKAQADVFYGDSYRWFPKKADCFIKTYPDELKKDFFLTNTLAHQSSFIKRDLFALYGGYREDFKIVSDKEKWLCFMEKGVCFQHLPFPCSRFRMNGISRQPSAVLRAEKIAMLTAYFPSEVLYNSSQPYLQELFASQKMMSQKTL